MEQAGGGVVVVVSLYRKVQLEKVGVGEGRGPVHSLWTNKQTRLKTYLRHYVRTRLHRASASTLQQYCNDASHTSFIENNGATPKWVVINSGVTPLFSIRAVSRIASVFTVLTLKLSVNDPLVGDNSYRKHSVTKRGR